MLERITICFFVWFSQDATGFLFRARLDAARVVSVGESIEDRAGPLAGRDRLRATPNHPSQSTDF